MAYDSHARDVVEAFARDEHNRPETTLESLAKLKPVFRPDGTITAVRKTLQLAGWSIRDLERVEINEAFAAEGGAIAHGHPIGATGAVLTTRLRTPCAPTD